jgi:hypothetical protein
MRNTCPTHNDNGLSRLACSVCGNKDRFIEVMAEEAHLVNGRKDYIRLLEGIVDRYLCWKCGAKVETERAEGA